MRIRRIAALLVILFISLAGISTAYAAEKGYTGISYNQEHNAWEYYFNGKPDYKFSGIATSDYNGKEYGVVKGVVDFQFTGVVKKHETGEWIYVYNSRPKMNYTGIAKSSYDGKNYFVRNGKVDWKFTGVAYNPETKTWDYCKKGRYQQDYRGAAKSVLNGKYYFVRDGSVDFTFTGLCYSPDHKTYIYVEKGLFNKKYTGPAKSADTNKIYHVKKGLWDQTTGTYSDDNNNYYYKKGRLQDSVFNLGEAAQFADASGKVVKEGVVKAQSGKYYFVNPKTNTVKQKKGFFDYNGKRYYSMGGGRLKGATLFAVDGVYYGAAADASLAKSGWVKTGKLYYKFQDYSPTATSLKAAELLKGFNYKLYDAYMWSASMPYYRFNAKSSWGIDWFAGYGFEKKRGNCYVMAGTFYYFAKELGYNVRQVEGYVDVIHSWDEIKEKGKTYVYDPCYDNETNDTAWKITYGQKGKWWYNNYQKMSE